MAERLRWARSRALTLRMRGAAGLLLDVVVRGSRWGVQFLDVLVRLPCKRSGEMHVMLVGSGRALRAGDSSWVEAFRLPAGSSLLLPAVQSLLLPTMQVRGGLSLLERFPAPLASAARRLCSAGSVGLVSSCMMDVLVMEDSRSVDSMAAVDQQLLQGQSLLGAVRDRAAAPMHGAGGNGAPWLALLLVTLGAAAVIRL